MKLFRDKNRGPKVKSEDVVIPEEYLEYEREAEIRKQQMQKEDQTDDGSRHKETEEDPFARRIDELMNTSKQTLKERAASGEDASQTDVTLGEIVDTIGQMMPETSDESNTADSDEEENDLESALRAERERSSRAAKKARKREAKKPPSASIIKNRSVETHFADRDAQKEITQRQISGAFVALLAAITIFVTAVVVLLGPLMRIDHVEVNDLKNMSEAQVEEIAGSPVGQNLFLFGVGNAEQELSYYPYVQDVQIQRHFPHWLEITITERQPAGVLLNNGSYLLFSKDGVLLDTTETLTDQNLPLITGFSMEDVPSPGTAFKDNARFSDILKIVNACSDELLTMIQEINIKDRNNILAYTSQGLEIRIGNVDNIETRMANLNDIMNQVILSGIVEEPISAIDIRYERSPVLVLEGYENNDASEYVNDEDDASATGENEETTNARASADNNVSAEGAAADGNASTNTESNNNGLVNDDQVQTETQATDTNATE